LTEIAPAPKYPTYAFNTVILLGPVSLRQPKNLYQLSLVSPAWIYSVMMNIALSSKVLDSKSLVPPNQRRKTILITALTLMWVVLVLSGLMILWNYQSTPGVSSQPPTHWPAGTQSSWNKMRPTLVMFAHPRCPCTRASIHELAQIMTYGTERVDARVQFFKPASFPEEWEQSDLWAAASEIPGVTVTTDIDGNSAKRFKATTSGYVVLYDTKGQLMFQGGITGSRGHTGENAGRSAVLSVLSNGNAETLSTLTFGCSLRGINEARLQEKEK